MSGGYTYGTPWQWLPCPMCAKWWVCPDGNPRPQNLAGRPLYGYDWPLPFVQGHYQGSSPISPRRRWPGRSATVWISNTADEAQAPGTAILMAAHNP